MHRGCHLLRHRFIKEILEWLLVVVVAGGIAFVVVHFIIANAYVPSSSMENTIMTDDRIIGLRMAYTFSEPERGDIIMFRYPDDEESTFIKRIIGLPGDHIEIIEGLVFVNGSEEALVEPYVKGVPIGSWGPYDVPEDCYFCLGDNRNVSKDSRYWTNTYVKREQIVAKAVLRYFPSIDMLE